MSQTAGATVAGHFGELIQGRLGQDGPIALITLPCPVLVAQASRRPGPFAIHQPDARVLDARRVAGFLRDLGEKPSGRFTLRIGMPPGGGAGASTAALVALARAAGVEDGLRIAAACLAAEGATDPLMFPAPERLLWASRQGRVLAALPALPRMEIVGGFFGAPVATDPTDSNFPDITDLVAAWPAACRDLASLCQLISQSAARTLALRGPAFDPTARIAAATGALGYAIAHTGSARALIFAPQSVPEATVAHLRRAGFCRITRFRVGGG